MFAGTLKGLRLMKPEDLKGMFEILRVGEIPPSRAG
jgi:hypothetical protein